MIGKLPILEKFKRQEAQGTEHVVHFKGALVEKRQRTDGYVPVITAAGKIGLSYATPLQYLRRLELQNDLFGDNIRIIGLTSANRFAITQPTLKGGEPSEIEIRDMLTAAGWKRVPMELQDLPPALMGTAWWHSEEQVILLDARKPNLKKTDKELVLPIDLILADLTDDLAKLLS